MKKLFLLLSAFTMCLILFSCANTKNESVATIGANEVENSTTLSSGNNNTIQTQKPTFSYKLYNSILQNIENEKTIYVYDKTGDNIDGVEQKVFYVGYQLYDINNDGIKELFIYRNILYFNTFIDSVYTIIDGQVVPFNISDYTSVETLSDSDVYYAIRDGRILKVFYHYAIVEYFVVYDLKKNEVDTYNYEITQQIWTKNGEAIPENVEMSTFNHLMSLVGFFDTEIQQGLITDSEVIDSSNKYLIKGMPSEQVSLWDDGYFYIDGNKQINTWMYYISNYYHVDSNGKIEKNKWIENRYVGSDGRMYRSKQTPDGKWVGDNGTIVEDIFADLKNSMLIEEVKPDSWYKTQAGLWYYFENDRTTTKRGWFTDERDNQTYYLDPATGIMAVGWTTIEGSEYYFNESHDNENNWYETGEGFYESYNKKVKAYGSMFADETTPDGKKVDKNGKLIK